MKSHHFDKPTLPWTGTGATEKSKWIFYQKLDVSMPSRAYTSFLPKRCQTQMVKSPSGVNALSGLYLISTKRHVEDWTRIEGCQCPFGLIPHFYVPLQKSRFYAVSRACFCRYLSEYSDNNRFSCMLTFWTYLMRCTYPWHWI